MSCSSRAGGKHTEIKIKALCTMGNKIKKDFAGNEKKYMIMNIEG
jgi:hypothetical protein